MKKSLILAALTAISSFCVFGADTNATTLAAAKSMDAWTPFQLVFLPGFPAGSMTNNVRGLKLGIPATGGNGSIDGVEASFFYSGTSFRNKDSHVRGIQASWFGPSLASNVYGINATCSYAYAEKLIGFQAAGVAFLGSPSIGCQAGLGAVAMSDFKGFQCGATAVTSGKMHGFQFSAANVATEMNGFQCGAVGVARKASGVQINLVNIISEVSDAFQCGIFNYSTGKGVQLGAVNIISGSWLPVMVIFNCKF